MPRCSTQSGFWVTEQAIDFLVIGMRSQEGERRDKRAGADTGNAVELWQRVRP